MPSDLLAVIEATYRMDLEEGPWLETIATAAQPLLDRGLGVVAYTIERGDDGAHSLGSLVARPDEPSMRAFAQSKLGVMPPPVAETLLEVPIGYGASSEIAGAEAIRAFLGDNAFGVVDTAGVQGLDISGASAWIVIPSQTVIAIEKGARARWQRVAAHLAAAIRLRRALQRDETRADDLDGADAVFEADGRVAEAKPHVESSLERLRHFAMNVDRARGRQRREAPDDALELWRGLCEGSWSLVDHFDRDGRRYIVARRNEPEVRVDRSLTRREMQVVAFVAFGHPDKLVAYELGIEEGTVQRHLMAAMRKMGVTSRLELVRLALALGSSGPPAA